MTAPHYNSVRALFLHTRAGQIRTGIMLHLLEEGQASAKALMAVVNVTYEALTARLSDLRKAGLLNTCPPQIHTSLNGRPTNWYGLTRQGADVAVLLDEYQKLDARLDAARLSFCNSGA